jgi:hypothetical protein
MNKITDRIPFDSWINSQLSIARFYGGITINGKQYIFDHEAREEENGLIKPDLITYDE